MATSGWQYLPIDAIKAKAAGAIAIGPFGSRMKSDVYLPTGVPVIRGSNISDTRVLSGDFVFVSPATADSLRPSNVFPGDLIFPHRGTIGEVGIVPEGDQTRYMLSTSLMKLSCDLTMVDPEFVFYFFRSPQGREELLQRASTVGTPGIGQPLSSLKSIKIPVPPMDEQRAIAHILGTFDDKIELNRRMSETLEATAQALFESWFVNFDPVRDKAERPESCMPRQLADLFPDSFEEVETGEVPKGWRVGRVSDYAEINARILRSTDTLDVIDYVEIRDVMRGEIRSVTRYQRGAAPSRARRRLGHGDMVLSTVRPDRGAHFLCLDPPDTLVASTGFAVLSARDGNWAFLYAALSRRDVDEELGRLADGGAYPAVRPETIGGLRLVYPASSALIEAFESVVRPMYRRAEQNRRESRTLSTLRDTLLPKLLSGELRIKDAERFVGRHT
jgi:type I restriction enzyme, S subunit